MKMTSSAAAKLLRSITEERNSLLEMERVSRTFLAAVGEDIESVRPEYDMDTVNKKVCALESDMRKIKHALNIFNTTTVVPEFDMTIDELLVYIPQLTMRVNKFAEMKSVLPKEREAFARGAAPIIDYRYANYDVSAAADEYRKAADTLSKAQLALDTVNNTVTMEIDIAIE